MYAQRRKYIFADLVREIEGDVEIDFIAVSSYGAGTKSSGEVKMIKDLSEPIRDKNVIIVEDIIDTGITLCYLKNFCLHAHRKHSKFARCSTSRQEEKSTLRAIMSDLKSKTNLLSDMVLTMTKNEKLQGRLRACARGLRWLRKKTY